MTHLLVKNLLALTFGFVASSIPVMAAASETMVFPQDESSYEYVGRVDLLPFTIRQACADNKGRLADIGEMWEMTDAITDPTIARARMSWAVSSGRYIVAACKQGGYSPTTLLLAGTRDTSSSLGTVVAQKSVHGDRFLEHALVELGLSKPAP